MKIRRIQGVDTESNMFKGIYYEGNVEGIKVGRRVWIDSEGSLFKTDIVFKKKKDIFRTRKALYEIVY